MVRLIRYDQQWIVEWVATRIYQKDLRTQVTDRVRF